MKVNYPIVCKSLKDETIYLIGLADGIKRAEDIYKEVKGV